jgi:hypothetical protein
MGFPDRSTLPWPLVVVLPLVTEKDQSARLMRKDFEIRQGAALQFP